MPNHHAQKNVHFGRNTEYPVFSKEPPVVVRGRYEVPDTPMLHPRSLPSTPATEQRVLQQECGNPLSADGTHGRAAPAARYPAASSSSPSSRELCRELQRFPASWPVRKTQAVKLGFLPFCDAYAFESRFKTCVLRFEGKVESETWTAQVGPRADGKGLRVMDILRKIEDELYTIDDGTGLYDGHVGQSDARESRSNRELFGEQDTRQSQFRAIDVYDWRTSQFFLGLKEERTADGIQYLVVLGPRAL